MRNGSASEGKRGKAATLVAEAVEHLRCGAVAEAERLLRRALDRDPQQPDALQHLGVLAAQRGDVAAAIGLFERAVRAAPRSADARTNLGYALVLADRHAEALAAYDEAIRLSPGYAVAWNHRGHSLARLNRPDEALASYDRAVALEPGFADAHYNRGNLLTSVGRFDEAVTSYDRALALVPGRPLPAINRANALRALGRLEEAVAALDRVLAADPRQVLALVNRGHMLSDLKRFPEAIASYERAVSIEPGHPLAPSPLAWAAMAICDFPRAERAAAALADMVRQGRVMVQPFTLLSAVDDPALQLVGARASIATTVPPVPAPLVATARAAASGGADRDRLRIAYLSADFRRHATVPLIAGLMERHDRARFEVVAMSTGADDGSAERQRIRAAADSFVDAAGLTDAAIARQIHAQKVDILVDLNGHALGGRPGVLAHRPAPVQVNYLGYPGTSGADFVDYLIADEIILPPGCEPFYSEALVRLPGYYAAYDPGAVSVTDTPSRQAAGLPEQGFVFCCLNNTYKITRPVFEVWMRLLVAVPGSVLWLLGDTPAAVENLRREAAARGVEADRLVFAARVPPEVHLARHRLADLFLDTTPVNAHTTACDALWTGLPVVTCPGRSFVSRVAASLLISAGFPELVAASLADYEALALRLATDPERLAACRARLAGDRHRLVPFDVDRLRGAIEAAYDEMWALHRAGEPPRTLTVTAATPC
ncbi:MAG: tetratricopeptide repeat protein [Rhodovulum sp.]|nr:tetratricopeptide repeat protein [Rhodovulum sp.]